MNEEEKKAVEILKEIEINTYAERKAIAIDTVLKLVERLQVENEKLKVSDSSNSKIIANMSTRHFQDREKIRNSIPVQKIKDKIEEIQEEGYWLFTTDRDSDKCVEVLQELLEK